MTMRSSVDHCGEELAQVPRRRARASALRRHRSRYLSFPVALTFTIVVLAWHTKAWVVLPDKRKQISKPLIYQSPQQTVDESSSISFTVPSPPKQPQQLGRFERLENVNRDQRHVIVEDWTRSSEFVPFQAAWDYQKHLLQGHLDRLQHNRHMAKQAKDQHVQDLSSFLSSPQVEQLDESSSLSLAGIDRILILEHTPVYTLGTASDPSYILQSSDDIDIVRMDRGGEVTYHGPGQVTVYPILDLRNYNQDIHWYMRSLEQVVLQACADFSKATIKNPSVNMTLAANAERDDDTTGVWMEGHKIAAVGIKCSRWITQHGVAINITPQSLAGFVGIVPCGLTGRKVGCLQQFVQTTSSSTDTEEGRGCQQEEITIRDFVPFLIAALEDVFQVTAIVDRTATGPQK